MNDEKNHGFLKFIRWLVASQIQNIKREGDVGMQYENDADKVLKEVEKRKNRAEELMIEDIILELFFGKGYGSFSTYKFERASIILNFEKENDANWKFMKCNFNLRNKKCTISYIKKEDIFEIFVDEKRVLAMKMMNNPTPVRGDPYISEIDHWHCWEIDAFIEGSWIQDLKDLLKQIALEEEEAKKREREAPDRIKKLKENFGIDDK